MCFDCRKEIAQLCARSDHVHQAVKLLAALITVDASVWMVIKDAVDQLLDVFVHSITRCLT